MNQKWVVVFFSTIFAFAAAGCANKHSSAPVKKGTVTELMAVPKGVTWHYSNGSVATNFHFDVNYKVNFDEKTLSVSTFRGGSVASATPPDHDVLLSDGEIQNLKSLLGKITFLSCATGDRSVGGSDDSLAIISLAAPMSYVYNVDCTGNGSDASSQATSGYTEFTNYLQSL